MSAHRFQVRVYYEDTDFSGVVYHANYLRYLERARTELLRDRGIEQGEILAGRAGEIFGFVVRAMTIDFLRPARMDDLLVVETIPREFKAASFELEQRVLRGEEALVTAIVRVACVKEGRAARIPRDVWEKLAPPAATNR